MALSTLARHLKEQCGEQRLSGNIMAGESRLITWNWPRCRLRQQLEAAQRPYGVVVQRPESGGCSGFDGQTLAELVSVLERL